MPRVLNQLLRALLRGSPARLFAVGLVALGMAGCGGCVETTTDSAGQGADAGPAGERGGYVAVTSLIDSLGLCDIDHRGLLIDFGGESMVGRYAWELTTPEGIVSSEHDGASWARIYDREVRLSFQLPEDTPLFVSLRAIGRDATSVAIYLDSYGLDRIKLKRQEIRVGSTRTTPLSADAGLHELKLRFQGPERSGSEPYAELDWVRIGVPDELQRTYGAPAISQVLAPAAELGGVPHRALGLRAPASVRCPLRIPARSRLRAAIGMRGDGRATAAVMVHEDGQSPVTIHQVEVEGGNDAKWSDIDVDLDSFQSRIVAIGLTVVKTTGTGRLLFGDPVLVVPDVTAAQTARAQSAVIVVLNGTERADLPPWRETETPHLPNLTKLSQQATVFDQHRAPSSLVSGAVASLLTGVSPRSHGLVDDGAKLPQAVTTIGGIARDASIRAAMFTGVPLTFRPFGFDRQWDSFTQYPPNEGRLATAPIDDAALWLRDAPKKADEGRPLLAVIHARGGHPPWDITPPEADKLPPTGYTGYLGPRRAAQLLAKVREHRSRLSEADRERLRALYFAGLSGQDKALGKLVDGLKEAGRWDSTLLVVTGDVSSARRTLFADSVELDEDALSLPLYVHFPGKAQAGTRVDRPTEIYDITRTALTALGLEPPADMLGRDLSAVVYGPQGTDMQLGRVAFTDSEYSVRWGDLVLQGRLGKRPSLCELLRDPTCAVDRSELLPLTTLAIFRRLSLFDSAVAQRPAREPLSIDSETAAMLSVWGVY